ncbi:STAS domain-containing protein [Sulfurimonas sp. NWX79]|uniref:STAS domain-containing protein n=1 Tax=Sulfurimonas sp. NWX79 TaxID=2925412 RepID=UPI0032048BB4
MKIEQDELSIYEVENLHKAILAEFEQENIIVDMTNVNKVDMSVIQLFLSAQKSTLEESKSFELINLSQEVKEIIQNAGCAPLLLIGESDE